MEQLSDTIGILGIYTALMAVLAICVEAVLGFLKLKAPILQGNPSPEVVLRNISLWLPEGDETNTNVRIAARNNLMESYGQDKWTAELKDSEIAERISKATEKHIEIERNRRSLIRLITILLGFGFAALLQIDTIEILAPLFQGSGSIWKTSITANSSHFFGLLLSGIAASAGSSLWHDKSAQYRSLKRTSLASKEFSKSVRVTSKTPEEK